ncbi:hypothetical protein JCGZ_25675 [Jatropha curcas]|uniref:Uncharacterized protein n=1 Tax=Jatropha curcas TaxID=180498 RepID=E2CXJ5_JATCU|nr:hypothetical protein [Jatropha curcas]KDP24379.1 hypothetical protein JCGZ_25675 [Jatropha curcas]
MKKAFLLICILLATISLSPSLTSARELAAIGKDAGIPIRWKWPGKPFGCLVKKNCLPPIPPIKRFPPRRRIYAPPPPR